MASKLRRAPLFGLDSPLGIPPLPKYSPTTTTPHPHAPAYKCTSAPPPVTSRTLISTPSNKKAPPPPPPKLVQKAREFKPHNMEVGVASFVQSGVGGGASPDRARSFTQSAGASPDRGRGPRGSPRSSPRSGLHVEFAQVGEMKERKEKYLTAKYGAHQMSLIRKRLGVEMWMYDQLQALYTNPKDGKSEEKEIDLDELLDLEEELSRRRLMWRHLGDCKAPRDKLEKFIEELLQRAKTL